MVKYRDKLKAVVNNINMVFITVKHNFVLY
jgi:hypothetical protein